MEGVLAGAVASARVVFMSLARILVLVLVLVR